MRFGWFNFVDIDKAKIVIWTNFGYGTVEDAKTVSQLNNKKYIKVK